ncbi:MAG TPA: PIG-L family deacetylase [Opitutaceae bacterium]|nr:PIG-L family deacetylase [Opitutaceae bacterium]
MRRAIRPTRHHKSSSAAGERSPLFPVREAIPGRSGGQARSWRRLGTCALATLAGFGLSSPTAATATSAAPPAASAPANRDAIAALHQLRTFATTGRVLHIGAHPDDENTQLITYLSRGRGYDTAYLSITRGDGGQNLLGPQFGELLGVARTQELLAARRIDGGRQYFTRAIDFGFSKNPEETLRIWNRREVLGDVVRVIREFRPDVIVTRFPIPPGSGGHGHHTASAILAFEAFKLAADPTAYPGQLREGLKPWQAKRIVWNVFTFGGRGTGPLHGPTIQVDIGGDDPVTGEAFGTIANRSRGMHKTQGMGGFSTRRSSGPNPQTFMLLAGEPMQHDIMDGVDTTWSRVPGGADIGRLTQAAIAAFNPRDPAASVPALLAIRRELARLPDGTIVDDKRAQLDRVVQRCLGLDVQTLAAESDVVPGETVPAKAVVRVAGRLPVTWVSVDVPGRHITINADVPADGSASRAVEYPVARETPLTQPYWLREPPAPGMYQVADPTLIGRPENPPALPVTYTLTVGGQRLVLRDELRGTRSLADADAPADRRFPLVTIVPPVSLAFESGGVTLFRPGTSRDLTVTVTAARPQVAGDLRLEAPDGWKVGAAQPFRIAAAGGKASLRFTVTAPDAPTVDALSAHARVGGFDCTTSRIEIDYSHIPRQLVQPPAREKLVSVDVATRGHRIGYLPGAGDDIPEALAQLGYQVTTLSGADLVPATLDSLDAVVIGVRAYNTRTDLVPRLPALFAYVEQGGTVIAQYSRPGNDLKTEQIGPYPLRLSDRRVTDETAAVTFLVPDAPVLNTPNRITPADFDGWVQERGVYFPSEWDPHFVPMLAMNDPGEAPLQGALLVASYGKGYFVYTGLAFFRQLPAGVPGAYRLFANLVSLGK